MKYVRLLCLYMSQTKKALIFLITVMYIKHFKGGLVLTWFRNYLFIRTQIVEIPLY